MDSSPFRSLHEEARLSEADELLQIIGLRTVRGEVRAEKRRKYEQVFRLIDEVIDLLGSPLPKRKLTLLDCGCGKSYVSFALNAYLTRERDRKCVVYGVDSDPERVRQAEATRTPGAAVARVIERTKCDALFAGAHVGSGRRSDVTVSHAEEILLHTDIPVVIEP